MLSILTLSISCDKDDAPAAVEVAPSLIGKWEYVQETQSNGQLGDYGHEQGCNKDYLEITATEYKESYYGNFPTPCNFTQSNATYTLSGSSMTLNYQNPFTIEITTLTATQLIFADEGHISVLKRI